MRRAPLLFLCAFLARCACQTPSQQDSGPEDPCAGSCSAGTRCVDGACWLEDCPGYDCGPGELCLQGRCRAETCTDVQCAEGTSCADGRCLPESCAAITCAPGDVCENGACVDARCVGLICPADQTCAAGQCWFPACGNMPCTGGGLCVAGQCTVRSCIGIICPPNRACVDGACEGCVAGFYQDGPSCLPQKPDGQSCSFDVQCLSGRCESQECCTGAACRISKMNGEACAAPTECQSGRCIGGTCCDSSCDGGCQGCSSGTCSSLQSGAIDPLCNGTVCQGGTGCPTSCMADADCAPTHHCAMGMCAVDKPLGGTCGRADECGSGFCADGVCCNTACDAGCQTCLGATAGTCSAMPANSVDPLCGAYLCRGATSCPTSCGSQGECVAGGMCTNNRCVANFGLGTPCVVGSDCSSGYCSDGVCCDTDCNQPCDVCNLASDAGRCQLAASGAAGAPACSPYACTGAAASCATSCTSDTQCAQGHFCVSGQCAPVPVGMMTPWAGSGAPPFGWLIADGSPISRTAEPALFAVIGTTFGAGDGVSTFNLPDLRGRSALGFRDAGAPFGATGGALPHRHAMTLPAHAHAVTYGSHTHAGNAPAHDHTWSFNCSGQAERRQPGGGLGADILPSGSYSGTTDTTSPSITIQSVAGLSGMTSSDAPDASVTDVATPYLAMRWVIRTRDDGALPCGSIWYSGRSQATAGAVPANGAALPSTDPRSCIGGAFGDAGPGSFRLPDLRGRFAIGLSSNGAGSTFGEASGTLDHTHAVSSVSTHIATLPQHQHGLSGSPHRHDLSGGGNTRESSGSGAASVTAIGESWLGGRRTENAGPNQTGPSQVHSATVAPALFSGTSSAGTPPWLALDPLLLDVTAARPPVGLLAAWPATTVPNGWLPCDGRAVSRTTYAALFTAIGTTFGAGDGSTTFNLPNLTGRMALGRTGALGASGGTLGHVHNVSFGSHAHLVTAPQHGHSVAPHAHAIQLDKASHSIGTNLSACMTSANAITSSQSGGFDAGLSAPPPVMSATFNAGSATTGPGDAPYLALQWLIRY